MSKAWLKFKNTKFYKWNKKHKKLIITGVILIALVLVFTLPFIDYNNVKYNFDYALNKYQENNTGTDGDSKEYNFNNESSIETKTIDDGTTSENGALLNEGKSTSYDISIEHDGKYYFYVDYYVLHSGFQDSEFSIFIDGEERLSRIKLRANWHEDNATYKTDSYGNEIVPEQKLVSKWINTGIYDYNFLTALPYEFDLKSGLHVIKFECSSGDDILLGKLNVKPRDTILSYEQYHLLNQSASKGERLENALEGEHVSLKNDTSPIPTNSSDINAYPYDTNITLLNTISNFDESSQILTYDFNAPSSGLYVFNFIAQVDNSTQTTFATILIDGELPFGELLHYPFESENSIDEYVLKDRNGNPFEIYLSEGIHSLSIKIDTSLYENVFSTLDEATETLNSTYLSLKRIAGSVSDNNKEWNPDTDFPGIYEKLQEIQSNLENLIPEIKKINGTDNNINSTIYIQSAISSLKGVIKNPRKIPNNYSKFSEGTGSIIENLANAKSSLESLPLDIDRIIVGNSSNYKLANKKNKYNALWENTKKFFASFFKDYSTTSSSSDTLEIWVGRSRQYVDLMQQLIDSSDFKKQTGYDVKFTILADESKLILSNAAGISPDGVMGISNWLPYEMGIRDLTVDLTQFPDYGTVIDRFSPGAMISLIADGKGLALPETQDFYVMYYRKDICEEYGFDLPSTWQDVIELLPEMQRSGFNFYIPLSTSTSSKSIMTTAPFIYQYGGNLFSDDGLSTTIDNEESLNAIKLMTELYTLYGLESQVSNFFDSFRNGSLPIGISTFDTYVKLLIAAPEISGKWDIALTPGVEQADGTIARWQTGSAQSMCLINKTDAKNKAGWELLKWWSSASVQQEFTTRLSLIYGKSYVWNSANLEAFNESIVFTKKQKSVILDQWEWMREIPRVPGWYMLERELSNSWNDIVLNAKNTRAVIEDAVSVINKEIRRKLIEFGYLDDNGNVIKPYKITTLQSVEELKK